MAMQRLFRWLKPRSHQRPFTIKVVAAIVALGVFLGFLVGLQNPDRAPIKHNAAQTFDEAFRHLEHINVRALSALPKQERDLLLVYLNFVESPEPREIKPLEKLANQTPQARYTSALLGAAYAKEYRLDAAFEAYFKEIQLGFWAPAWERAFMLAVSQKNADWLKRMRSHPDCPRARESMDTLALRQLLTYENDFLGLVGVEIRYWREEMVGNPSMTLLAAVGGFVWLIFLHGLAGLPMHRCGVTLLAVLLGFTSTIPTLFISNLQHQFNNLELNGDLLNDLLYCVCGIGLREELSKLLLFIPFIFYLRRRPLIETVVVAGCVGLGFAINENVGYFGHDVGKAHVTAVGRLFTANFLHISLTALAGLGLMQLLYKRGSAVGEPYPPIVLILASVIIHGVYDFLIIGNLSHHYSPGYFTMILMLFTFNWMLQKCRELRLTHPARAHISPSFNFAVSLAVLWSLALVVSVPMVGLFGAFLDLFGSAIGAVILWILFARNLSH